MVNVPFRERLSASVEETIEATDLGRTYLYELIGQGKIRTFKVGRRRLIDVRSIIQLLESRVA